MRNSFILQYDVTSSRDRFSAIQVSLPPFCGSYGFHTMNLFIQEVGCDHLARYLVCCNDHSFFLGSHNVVTSGNQMVPRAFLTHLCESLSGDSILFKFLCGSDCTWFGLFPAWVIAGNGTKASLLAIKAPSTLNFWYYEVASKASHFKILINWIHPD